MSTTAEQIDLWRLAPREHLVLGVADEPPRPVVGSPVFADTRAWQIVDRCRETPTLCHMRTPGRERLMRLVRRRGIVAAHEVGEEGLHRQLLTRLTREGALVRVARGRYAASDHPATENHALALAAAAVPRAVICLLSALSFHGVGTQLPPEVWIAIDRRARRPALRHPRLHVVRFGGRALTEGVETHRIEGQPVRIYGVAKTLADLFKYRNKIGMDVVLEALRDAWRERRFTMDELDRFGRVCRVEGVMRPYLESLVA
jgi:predicted transcriptional regulator of viral defense system